MVFIHEHQLASACLVDLQVSRTQEKRRVKIVGDTEAKTWGQGVGDNAMQSSYKAMYCS